MKTLETKELKEIKGGLSLASILGIGSFITFIIGAIDGLNRLKWQKRKSTEFKGNLKGKPLIQIQQKDVIMFIKLLDLRLI